MCDLHSKKIWKFRVKHYESIRIREKVRMGKGVFLSSWDPFRISIENFGFYRQGWLLKLQNSKDLNGENWILQTLLSETCLEWISNNWSKFWYKWELTDSSPLYNICLWFPLRIRLFSNAFGFLKNYKYDI